MGMQVNVLRFRRIDEENLVSIWNDFRNVRFQVCLKRKS